MAGALAAPRRPSCRPCNRGCTWTRHPHRPAPPHRRAGARADRDQPLQHRSAQQQLFAGFRSDLAQTVAPLGPYDLNGNPLSLGDPVAIIEIDDIGLRQVVVEGTTGGTLTHGPGHRRDTPFLGQAGVSIIAGRRAARRSLRPAASSRRGRPPRSLPARASLDHEVIGVRKEGDPLPDPIRSGEGRPSSLFTAAGRPLLPSGVRVDAELQSDPVPGARPLLSSALRRPTPRTSSAATPAASAARPAGSRPSWSWPSGWCGPGTAGAGAKSWIVFTPALVLVSVYLAGQTTQLLPNLL